MSRYAGYMAYMPKGEREDTVDPADAMPFYRPDPTGKFGGKEGIETRPTYGSKADLYDIASVMRDAQAAGMPPMSAEQLAHMVMLEGRGDAGGSAYNVKNPRAEGLASLLKQKYPGNYRGPAFAATVADKTEVAKRLNIPFEKAWNGTGKIPGTNWGGTEYAARAEQFKQTSALEHNKNAQFMDFIRRTMDDKLTPEEKTRATIKQVEERGTKLGGFTDGVQFKSHLMDVFKGDPNTMKLLKDVDPSALLHAAHNMYREHVGVPTKPHGAYMINENRGGARDVSFKDFRKSNSNERGEAEILVALPAVRQALEPMMGIEPQKPKDESMLDALKKKLGFSFGGVVPHAGNKKLI